MTRAFSIWWCVRATKLSSTQGKAAWFAQTGMSIAVLGGVPILLVSDSAPTHAEATFSLNAARLRELPDYGVIPTGLTVDPWVNEAIAATNGMLYLPVQGKLTEYPIPATSASTRQRTALCSKSDAIGVDGALLRRRPVIARSASILR